MQNSHSQPSLALRHSQIRVADADIHVVEGGSATDQAILFLHGFPQNWLTFHKVMNLASKQAHVVALDLPGIGGSKVATPAGDKRIIADYVHGVVQALDLNNVTLVGHDVGGMVAFAYLTSYSNELNRVVIMDTVIPGIDPWSAVIQNPYIWHFRFHNIPDLPEKLVQGKQADYFAYFFDTISKHPETITKEMRQLYSQAYSDPTALSTAFNWYRAFEQDANYNTTFANSNAQIETPLLYLRGKNEGGDIEEYIRGFQKAGLKKVESGMISDSGHYSPEEQPDEVWKLLAKFVN